MCIINMRISNHCFALPPLAPSNCPSPSRVAWSARTTRSHAGGLATEPIVCARRWPGAVRSPVCRKVGADAGRTRAWRCGGRRSIHPPRKAPSTHHFPHSHRPRTHPLAEPAPSHIRVHFRYHSCVNPLSAPRPASHPRFCPPHTRETQQATDWPGPRSPTTQNPDPILASAPPARIY